MEKKKIVFKHNGKQICPGKISLYSSLYKKYPIHGCGMYVGWEIEQDVLEHLEQAANNKDFVLYKKIVDENPDVFNGMESDYWRETFYEGDYDEILFWIDYPGRRLTIHDIFMISFTPSGDDLFQRGLCRKDLDFEGVETVIEVLEEALEDPESVPGCGNKNAIQKRIDVIKNKSGL